MSKYITRPLGEIFEVKGIKLKVVKHKTCEGCYFEGIAECLNYRGNTGYCGKLVRDDNRNVIFKRIEE